MFVYIVLLDPSVEEQYQDLIKLDFVSFSCINLANCILYRQVLAIVQHLNHIVSLSGLICFAWFSLYYYKPFISSIKYPNSTCNQHIISKGKAGKLGQLRFFVG